MRPRCWHSMTSNAGAQQREAHELEPGVARVARDREDRRERGLQALVLALLGGREFACRNARYDASCVSSRNGTSQDARALGEALADALLFGKRVQLRGRGRRHGGRAGLRITSGPRDARARHVARRAGRVARQARRASLVHRLSGSIALPGLVVGHYQPLADDGAIARDARPYLPSAVASESEAKRTRPERASLRSLIEAGRRKFRPPVIPLLQRIVRLRRRFAPLQLVDPRYAQ